MADSCRLEIERGNGDGRHGWVISAIEDQSDALPGMVGDVRRKLLGGKLAAGLSS